MKLVLLTIVVLYLSACNEVMRISSISEQIARQVIENEPDTPSKKFEDTDTESLKQAESLEKERLEKESPEKMKVRKMLEEQSTQHRTVVEKMKDMKTKIINFVK